MELRCRHSPLYLYSILYAYHEVGILKWQRFGSFFYRPRTKLRGRHFILTHGFNADTLKTQKEKKNIFEANPGGFFTPALNKTDMQGAQGSSRQPALEAGKHYLISKNTADTSRIPGARFPGSPRAKPRDCCPVPAVSLTLTAAKEVWLSSSYRKLRHRRTGLRLHSTHLFSLNPFYDTT